MPLLPRSALLLLPSAYFPLHRKGPTPVSSCSPHTSQDTPSVHRSRAATFQAASAPTQNPRSTRPPPHLPPPSCLVAADYPRLLVACLGACVPLAMEDGVNLGPLLAEVRMAAHCPAAALTMAAEVGARGRARLP